MATTKIRGNTQIMADTITNTEINSAAAIATSKLAQGAEFILRNGSVPFTGDNDHGGFRITNLGTPTNPGDAATKSYVDALTQGLDPKGSVRAATTANITLSGTQTVDGVALSIGDRVLVKNQSTASQNGIYVVASGAWTRATDADTNSKVTGGMFTFVEEGTTNADTGWLLTNDGAVTLGTTGLTFTQFSGAGQISAGAGLTKTGNTMDIVAGDNSLVVNADEVHVLKDPAGAIGVSASGLLVNVGAGIEISGNALRLAAAAAGAGLTGGGGSALAVGANADGSITVNADDIQVKRDAAGAIGTSANGLAVLVGANTGLQISGNALGIKLNGSSLTLGANGLSVTNAVPNFAVRETPTGLVNGSNVTYTLANTPVVGSEEVYVNGILQEAGAGNDYTISGATITMLTALVSGDKIRVCYRY